MKLYTINTVNNFMGLIYEPFGKPFTDAHEGLEMINIMDDSLLKGTRDAGKMTPEIAARMMHYANSAQGSGADGIIVTCTSVNEATQMIKPFMNVPMINIEEPTAAEAVAKGKKIGVLGTINTSPDAFNRTLKIKAAEANKDIVIKVAIAEGAFDVLCTGDRAKHDEMVNETLYKLAKEVDVVCFAQISMSLLKHDPIDKPLCMIGNSGYEQIYNMMLERRA